MSLSQTIFDGSTFANISAASHGRTAVAHSLEATRREIVFGTKQAYYGLLKALALRDVQAEALELAQEQLRKTESLFELGSASRSDLLKAQVQVGQAQLALISAETSAETARAGLCYTLGHRRVTAIEVVDPPGGRWEAEIEGFDLEEAISQASRRHGGRGVGRRGRRRSLLAAKAGRWPDLGFSLSYSRSAGVARRPLTTTSATTTRARWDLSLSVPIFNGLGTKASIDRGKSSLRTSELSLRDARLWAEYEIETARLVGAGAAESVQVAETAVEQAEEDLRVSEERFRLRAASMLELIDARVAYSRARADLVEGPLRLRDRQGRAEARARATDA